MATQKPVEWVSALITRSGGQIYLTGLCSVGRCCKSGIIYSGSGCDFQEFRIRPLLKKFFGKFKRIDFKRSNPPNFLYKQSKCLTQLNFGWSLRSELEIKIVPVTIFIYLLFHFLPDPEQINPETGSTVVRIQLDLDSQHWLRICKLKFY